MSLSEFYDPSPEFRRNRTIVAFAGTRVTELGLHAKDFLYLFTALQIDLDVGGGFGAC